MNERNNKQNERRVYTKEFKLDAVELTNKSDKPITEIASDLGISYQLLCKWRAKHLKDGKESFPGHGNLKENKEFKLLEKELKSVTEERDILKKAYVIFSRPQGRNTNL